MENTNNTGTYLRYAIGIGVVGALGYIAYKRGLIFKSFKEKRILAKFPELLKKLGPTFKQIDTSEKYGDIVYGDTVKIGDSDYVLYFYPFVKWKKDDAEMKIMQPFRLMNQKPGTTSGEKIIFAGTWALKNNKLSMKFVTREQMLNESGNPTWTKTQKELKKAPQYSGSLKEILKKASGGKKIKLDNAKS